MEERKNKKTKYKYLKKYLLISLIVFFGCMSASAQVEMDLNNLSLDKILGKILTVQRGFAPQFSLGNTPIKKVEKVAEILGLKKNEEIDRLFNTFKTGRTIYKIAAYAGGAIAAYGTIRAIDKAAAQSDYKGALISGLSTIATGLLVKLLTKGASYKAVDLFNGIVRNKIKKIFNIGAALQKPNKFMGNTAHK